MRLSPAFVLVIVGCRSDNGIRRLPEPPTVEINTPNEGAELRKGQGLQPFAGLVADEFDAPGDLTVTWRVDGGEAMPASAGTDGAVTLDLDVEGLTLGDHTVTLTAVDTDGESADATLGWRLVGPLGTPSVTITAPEDGSSYAPGTEISFRGVATDTTTAADDLVFTWSANTVGALKGAISGDGSSAVFAVLPIGSHVVTLSAADLDGEIGSDSVTVHVLTLEDTGPIETEPVETAETGETELPPVEPEPGDLVFSEMMINPSVVADDMGEWVELYNTASYPLDVTGYSFHDLDFDFYALDGPLIVDGHDYLVLCAEMSVLLNGGVPCDAPFKRKSADALALGNGDDEVILSRPDGTVIDEVRYSSEWFTSGAAIGVQVLDAAANDDQAQWCTQTSIVSTGGEPGTPGLPNDACL